MSPENEAALIALGPNVFRYELQFGMGCGDGWFDLLKELVTDMEAALSTMPADFRENFGVTRIKEKLGGLRCYVSLHNPAISNLIREAEEKSYQTCEDCGKRGQLRSTRNGWMYVSCPFHVHPGTSRILEDDQ